MGKSVKSHKNAQKSIIIVDVLGERYKIRKHTRFEFVSKGDCMKFLGTGTRTFSQFLKGRTKLNKRWRIEYVEPNKIKYVDQKIDALMGLLF